MKSNLELIAMKPNREDVKRCWGPQGVYRRCTACQEPNYRSTVICFFVPLFTSIPCCEIFIFQLVFHCILLYQFSKPMTNRNQPILDKLEHAPALEAKQASYTPTTCCMHAGRLRDHSVLQAAKQDGKPSTKSLPVPVRHQALTQPIQPTLSRTNHHLQHSFVHKHPPDSQCVSGSASL